jgi:predicted PurR-regulated permease PerM
MADFLFRLRSRIFDRINSMAKEFPIVTSNPPQEAALASAPRPFHWAQTLLGVAIILVICSYAEEVLVIALVSILLAFILAPIMEGLNYIKVPRPLAAALAVLLLLACVAGIFYLSYNQAANFVHQLPRYTTEARQEVARFSRKVESLGVFSEPRERGVINVRQTTNWTDLLSRGFGSLTQALLAASFVPFLVYFMLTWQEHARSSTVMLFPLENRHTAYVTLGMISAMIRSFMIGNLLIALFMGSVSTLVFGVLHLPFFYFVGFLSGILSLIPYMGVLLAILPPIFVSIGSLNSGTLITIVITVVALHLISMNVLYPKFLGPRLQLNPLAVSIALLVWAWLWGAIGLLLAIPMTAAMKIIFDHVESLKAYGAWLGE